MIRIGVIGTGFGALVHVPAFQQMQNVNVVGITSRDSAHRATVASRFGIRAFDSWQELVASPDIDAVSVALPASAHPEVVLAAIAHGKSVLCEKPLAPNVAEAERMFRAAEHAGVVAMTDFEFPEFPAWQRAKHILDRHELGAVQSVEITWTSGSWANPQRPWTWQCDAAQGGVLRALGIHCLHYLEWFCGDVQSLKAELSIGIAMRPDATGTMRSVTSENGAHLTLRLRSGASATIVLSNVIEDGKGQEIVFHGEHGTLILCNGIHPNAWEDFTLTEVKGDVRRTIEIPTSAVDGRSYSDGRIPAFMRIASRFTEAIEKRDTHVRPSFVDGLRAQVLLDAAYEAARQKQWIDISAPLP